MKTYCDASFDDKNKVAGIGIVVDDGYKRRTFAVFTKARTNNEAELFAIHIASILNEGKGVIYTDSMNAIQMIKGDIRDKQRTREQWINYKHCMFWAVQIRRRKIKVEKIKAHSTQFKTHLMGNNLADCLAREGRSKFYER